MLKTVSISLILLFCFSSINSTKGQQVLATSGNNFTTQHASISWTVGELAIESLTNNGQVITQGFHQTRLGTTGLDILPATEVDITAYPNPVSENVNIRIKDLTELKNWNYILYDQAGKVILKNKIDSDMTEVPVRSLVEAVYYLRVYSGSDQARVFKIVKQ